MTALSEMHHEYPFDQQRVVTTVEALRRIGYEVIGKVFLKGTRLFDLHIPPEFGPALKQVVREWGDQREDPVQQGIILSMHGRDVVRIPQNQDPSHLVMTILIDPGSRIRTALGLNAVLFALVSHATGESLINGESRSPLPPIVLADLRNNVKFVTQPRR